MLTLTRSQADCPLLIVDLYKVPAGRSAAVPSQIQSIENNLSIANMDFGFRGFPES